MRRCFKPAMAALSATSIGAPLFGERCRCDGQSYVIPACAAVGMAGVGWYLYSLPTAAAKTKALDLSSDKGNEANDLFTSAQELEGLVLLTVGSTKPTNLKRSIKLYEAAAEHGHPGAQERLAFLAANGFGMKRDLPRAVSLYTSAAEAGEAGAQYALSVLYMTGRGVEKNHAVARAWAQRAADQGA